MKQISKHIRKEMRLQGLTPYALAKKANLKTQTVYNVLSGKNTTVKNIKIIAETLNIKIEL